MGKEKEKKERKRMIQLQDIVDLIEHPQNRFWIVRMACEIHRTSNFTIGLKKKLYICANCLLYIQIIEHGKSKKMRGNNRNRKYLYGRQFRL